MDFNLSDHELERYARQLVMPELGGAGQMRLKGANVLVVGAGALGTVVGGYLAAAGIGRLGVVDPDRVDLSNLQRQVLYSLADIGHPKAQVAALRLGAMNDEILVEPYPTRIETANADALIAGRDVVVDCSDSFETRYLINDLAVKLGVPLVEAGVLGMDGVAMVILPGSSACYRCAFPEPPVPGTVPSCAEAGLLGPVAGVIGSLQALEVIKLVAGIGTPATDRVIQIEGNDLSFTTVRVQRRADCDACALAMSPGRSEPVESTIT